MYDAIQLVGWIGAASLLLVYGLLTNGKLAATGTKTRGRACRDGPIFGVGRAASRGRDGTPAGAHCPGESGERPKHGKQR